MKVLLIEDDRLLAREIAKALREENCAVDVAVNGEDGQHLGNTEACDAPCTSQTQNFDRAASIGFNDQGSSGM